MKLEEKEKKNYLCNQNKPIFLIMNKIVISLSLLTALAMPMTVKAQQLRADNIDEIVAALTDDEKVHMLTGAGTGWADPDVRFPGIAGWTYPVPRLGIPSVYLADGPHGVNMNRYRDFDHFDYSCTTTPTSTAMAATFDVNAVGKMGNLIGYELKERGLDVILGPAINLQRTALGGRNQEYMSEDPFLSGKLAAAYIRGVQNHGVGTSVKHFAGNEAETLRKQSDTRATPRTLRELYLKAFEIAVKEGQPWTIMTSYNYINGEHSTERPDLVTDILRGEWGFKGIAITDWDGGFYPAKITSAGTDIIEPGSDQIREELAKALADGSLDRNIVDKAIRRILEFTVKCPSFKQYKASNDIHRDEHLEWVREVGAEGMVLLKNEGQTLPVAPQKVALYGTTSYNLIAGNMGVGGTNGGAYHVTLVEGLRKAGFTIDMNLLRQHTRWQTEEDARLQSEASEDPIMTRILRPARAEELIPQEKVEVKEDPRMAQARQMNFNIGALMGNQNAPSTISEQVAKNDIAIITLGRTTGEGQDRNYKEFELRDSERQLIEVVSQAYHAAGKKVIVLLNVCAGIETQSWIGMVDAVLNIWEPGMAAGYSIADVLTGRVNPSGRMPQTWELKFGDQPADQNFPSDYHPKSIMEFLGSAKMSDNPQKNEELIDYEEGVFMGYRYFTSFNQKVAYPFGYGLSYTTFAYENASLEPTADGFQVTLTVKNTGKVAGKEVVQLYSAAPAGGLEKPVRELKAFAKTKNLKPGESQTLTLNVTNYELASYNEKAVAWQAAKGVYSIQLCKNANEVALTLPYKLAKAQSWKTTNSLALQSNLKVISLKKK